MDGWRGGSAPVPAPGGGGGGPRSRRRSQRPARLGGLRSHIVGRRNRDRHRDRHQGGSRISVTAPRHRPGCGGTNGCRLGSGETSNPPLPIGAFSSVSASASLSWGPRCWICAARPRAPSPKLPGSSSPSSSASCSAAASGGSSRGRKAPGKLIAPPAGGLSSPQPPPPASSCFSSRAGGGQHQPPPPPFLPKDPPPTHASLPSHVPPAGFAWLRWDAAGGKILPERSGALPACPRGVWREGGGLPRGCGAGAALLSCTGLHPWREAAGSSGARDRASLSVKLQPELPGGCFP